MPAETHADPILRVRDLHYGYPGADAPVLHDLAFHIEAGEVFGLAGVALSRVYRRRAE